MKTLQHVSRLGAAALLLAVANCRFATGFAQGSLTPPGAPAPTMKSLDQIEPRVPISSVPFTITQPGSYYLTTNITVSFGNAITINAGNVTLDLSGFMISSTANPPDGTAIFLNTGLTNITVRNGFISGGITNSGGAYGGAGFKNGISFSGSYPYPNNAHVSDISVYGCMNYGINLAYYNPTVVESCVVNLAGNYGIYAQNVSDSSAGNCGQIGIYAYNVSNCYGYGYNEGIYAFSANDCYGYSPNGDGLYSQVCNNCYGYSNGSYYGIATTCANNCYADSYAGIGLITTVASGCYAYTAGGSYALWATLATSCYANTENVTYKYNMP